MFRLAGGIALACCARVGAVDLPSQAVLRYAPEIGHTYTYDYTVNLDKTTYGRTGNEHAEGVFRVEAIGRENGRYRVRWAYRVNDHNLPPDAKAEQVQEVPISDRYVCTEQPIGNLCLPDEPVGPGATWEGQDLFQFGDLLTSRPPEVDVAFRLLRFERKDGRSCAMIECRPKTGEVEVPFEMGQLGLHCDDEGRVRRVRSGSPAEGIVLPGDLLRAVNGRSAVTPGERSGLMQRFVESSLRDPGPVKLELLRGGETVAVEVTPVVERLGAIAVRLEEVRRTVWFDVAKRIPVSDHTTARYAVTHRADSPAPEFDDYVGRDDPVKWPGTDAPPRIYDYTWRLDLRP